MAVRAGAQLGALRGEARGLESDPHGGAELARHAGLDDTPPPKGWPEPGQLAGAVVLSDVQASSLDLTWPDAISRLYSHRLGSLPFHAGVIVESNSVRRGTVRLWPCAGVSAPRMIPFMNERELSKRLREFAAERNWEQFHTPKNLAIALSTEAAELLELFQWSKGAGSWDELNEPRLRARVEEELSDVLLYLLRFGDLAGIDLEAAALRKIDVNAGKYPADRFKGTDKKYNEP